MSYNNLQILHMLIGLVLVNTVNVSVLGQTSYTMQAFRLTPHDTYVVEGTDTLLRCEISNQVGKVQWTKDGFALGFSAVILGYPRYSVIGDFKRGIYNLQISNTTLEDDAEYQCQVGPAKGNPAIRANAKLTIIAAPTSIYIESYAQNSKVEVIEKQNLTLTCVVENAKPPAEIVWYRGNIEYSDVNKPHNEIKETHLKTFNTISKLIIKPTAEDDYKDFSCQAKHRALPPDVPMRANVHLSVLYPPGPPFIEGYTNGENLRRGQKIELACRSRGGNPPAQLTWYKNGTAISSPQRNVGRLSENIYRFIVKPDDDGVLLTCEAKNILSENALKAEVHLSVTFSPTEAKIKGLNTAKNGEIVFLSCITAASNPAAEIFWNIDGQQANASSSNILHSHKGGWITVSNISISIESKKKSLTVVCLAVNSLLKETVTSSHTINVLYPPSTPVIKGYNESQVILAGSVQKLVCISQGGNPLPNINWYKNDKKLNSISKTNDSVIVSELTILANASDNNAHYKCQVENPAIEIPLFEINTLQVYFPPEAVKIRVEPENLRPGTIAKLTCDSSSSNPPALVSWWKDGIPVKGDNLSNRPGLWGGFVSSLELYVNITQDMHDIVYTCQSTNEALQRSVHDIISLNILYPPSFDTSQKLVFTGVENESLEMSLVVSANPKIMSFTWRKYDKLITPYNKLKNKKHIVLEGATLNILRLERSDAGTYSCEATNSQGSSEISVTLIVEYPPSIEAVSNSSSFTPGQDAILSCVIDANPLTADYVKWERPGYNMISRTMTTFVNKTSYLHISNVQHTDIGNFTCTADNQRGAIAQRNVLLVVESAPEIDTSPLVARFASILGERGLLKCVTKGAPSPIFTWRKNGKEVNTHRRNKYKNEQTQLNEMQTESRLYIEQVAEDDYGKFECIAKNMYGESRTEIELKKPSRPETPKALIVNNVTDNTVTLSWVSGFDGGLPVYFRIRYRQMEDEKYKYIETDPESKAASITGLKSNKAYVFSIMAINEVGGSKFLPDIKAVIAASISEAVSIQTMEKTEMPNLVIVGITSAAMILLVLNAALVAWFVIRRQNKNSSESDNHTDDAYSKTENQSEYKIDNHKKAASTYLVENVDIIQSAFPPKYQESSLSSPPYTISTDYTKTLPNPKRHAKILNDNRSKDDHMLVSNGLYIPSPSPASSLVIKGSYISSPSPAPPPDGSYFNMSDKYLSYPPVVY